MTGSFVMTINESRCVNVPVVSWGRIDGLVLERTEEITYNAVFYHSCGTPEDKSVTRL